MFAFKDLRNIHLELTTRCNARCGNCPRNFMGAKKYSWLKDSEYSIKEFKKYFPDEVLTQVKFVLLCGSYGDPAACKDLDEIVSYLMSYDIEVQINSNMSLRNVDSWKRIGNLLNEKSQIVLSIDGLEDTNHLYRRGTQWEKIEENVKALRGTKANVVWECLLFKHNEFQRNDIYKKAAEWGVNTVLFKNPMGFDVDSNGVRYMPMADNSGRVEYILFPHDQEVSKVYKAKMLLLLNIIRESSISRPEPKKYYQIKSNMSHSISCRSKNNNEVYIDAEGIVYPCCFFASYDNPVSLDFQLFDFLDTLERKNISLKNNSLREILDQNLFSSIESSWSCNSFEDGKLQVCEKYCSQKNGELSLLYEDK